MSFESEKKYSLHGLLLLVKRSLAAMNNRVEHQKRNQLTIEKRPFGSERENRVKHQKLNVGGTGAATCLRFWCSTRPSSDAGTDYNQQYPLSLCMMQLGGGGVRRMRRRCILNNDNGWCWSAFGFMVFTSITHVG